MYNNIYIYNIFHAAYNLVQSGTKVGGNTTNI